jgi:hypothetical protein
MRSRFSGQLRVCSCFAAIVAALHARPASAVDFQIGDGWQGTWSSTLSLSSSWRARDPDSALYGQDNGPLVGLTNGTGNNGTDEGNLNYEKGDAFSTQFKLITELSISKEGRGLFLRGKGWYDYTLNHSDVRYGNQPNGYNGYDPATNTFTRRKPLSDRGFERLAQFEGVYLLDAYVYDTFEVKGQPLQVRVGNQVVNWGESLFIQGVNVINPIDLPSFRKPGLQVKEVLLPVPIVLANQSFGAAGTLEVFYQAKWENTPIEGACGNYWGVAAGSISNSPGACNSVLGLAGPNPAAVAANAYIPTLKGKDAPDSGQFGASYRTYLDSLDTEFGLYAMKIHSRTPVVSVLYGGNGTLSPISAVWQYPEDIKVYGISASTNLGGWSTSAELSHRRGVPAQVDANDLLFSALGAAGAVAPGMNIPFGPYGPVALEAYNNGTMVKGYTRTNTTQLQFNAIKAGRGILGADQYILVGEVGIQWNTLGSNYRYGRPFIFGPGPDARYGAPCQALNISAEGCRNKGYVTHSAWGYRLRGELTYNDIFGSGIEFKPSVFWSHDVRGWSVDSQFSEERMALGLNAQFSYSKKYTLDLGATMFNRDADYDPLRDRGFYSASFAVNF